MANLAYDEAQLANDEVASLAADSARTRVAALGYVGGETPGAVYRNALETTTGQSARHIPAGQLRGLIEMGLQARRTGYTGMSPSPAVAMDAASVDDFAKRYGVTAAPRNLDR